MAALTPVDVSQVNIAPTLPQFGVYKDHIIGDCCKNPAICMASTCSFTIPCVLAQVAGRLEGGTPVCGTLRCLGRSNFTTFFRMSTILTVIWGICVTYLVWRSLPNQTTDGIFLALLYLFAVSCSGGGAGSGTGRRSGSWRRVAADLTCID